MIPQMTPLYLTNEAGKTALVVGWHPESRRPYVLALDVMRDPEPFLVRGDAFVSYSRTGPGDE